MEGYYKQAAKTDEGYKLGETKSQEIKEERDSEMWRMPPGGGVFAAPLVFKNVVFFGSYDTYFYAADKITGKIIWKFKTGDAIISSPTMHNKTVFFCSQDGFVYALEAETGKLIWHYRTGGLVATNAVVCQDRVYTGSSNGYMHCFSLSGELLWKYRTGNAVYSSPAFVNDRLYFGSYDGHFYCLDTDGGLVWKYYTGEWNENAPAIFANGKPVWDYKGKQSDYGGPASVCFGSYNKNFYVLDAENGKLQWMRRMDGVLGWSHPVVKDGFIFFGDWSGCLSCLDAESGSLQWKVLSGDRVSCHPLVYSSYIYFGSGDGNLYALSLEGKVSWKFQTGAGVWSSPAVSDGVLYFGSMDTNFYAMDLSTRKIIWKFVTGGGKPAPIEKILRLVEQIKESQKIFSAWKPELIKPAYKEDKNLTFVATPEHAYAAQTPYRTESPYSVRKKKEPWER